MDDQPNLEETYSIVHPLVRDILLNVFWEIPLAGGLMLQLSTAQAGPRNSQNMAKKGMRNPVET